MNSVEARKHLNLLDDIIAVNAGSWGPLCEAARDAIIKGYREEASSRGDDVNYMKSKGSGLSRYNVVVAVAKNT